MNLIYNIDSKEEAKGNKWDKQDIQNIQSRKIIKLFNLFKLTINNYKDSNQALSLFRELNEMIPNNSLMSIDFNESFLPIKEL